MKVCLKDLPVSKDSLSDVSSMVSSLGGSPPSQRVASQPLAEGASDKVSAVLDDLSKVETVNVNGVVPASSVNWNAALGEGAEYVASGRFGAFVEVPPERLAKGLEGRFPGGVGVKYGTVIRGEIEVLEKVSESGAGPKLIAAKLEAGSGFERKGMIAMERIPGPTLSKVRKGGTMSSNDLEDSYLKGLAALHKAGIMHGDPHLGNAILQPNGQVRFVDFGYAKFDPRRALAEALKATLEDESPVMGYGPFNSPASEKMRENLRGIRQEIREFNRGVLGEEESKKVALQLIEKLYEGV